MLPTLVAQEWAENSPVVILLDWDALSTARDEPNTTTVSVDQYFGELEVSNSFTLNKLFIGFINDLPDSVSPVWISSWDCSVIEEASDLLGLKKLGVIPYPHDHQPFSEAAIRFASEDLSPEDNVYDLTEDNTVTSNFFWINFAIAEMFPHDKVVAVSTGPIDIISHHELVSGLTRYVLAIDLGDFATLADIQMKVKELEDAV